MSDNRKHRGKHSKDNKLFAVKNIELLRKAVEDYALLLTKEYPPKGALKLVGDKFRFTERQRMAILRSACSDQSLLYRKNHEAILKKVILNEIYIDGYNLLITIESALSGGLIFIGRDGCYRDLSGIHGTYRSVEETIPALKLIGSNLIEMGIEMVNWLLDTPVSNSRRLKTLMASVAEENNWSWNIELHNNPDKILTEAKLPVATSDSVILDNSKSWINLAAHIISNKIKAANIINLAPQ